MNCIFKNEFLDFLHQFEDDYPISSTEIVGHLIMIDFSLSKSDYSSLNDSNYTEYIDELYTSHFSKERIEYLFKYPTYHFLLVLNSIFSDMNDIHSFQCIGAYQTMIDPELDWINEDYSYNKAPLQKVLTEEYYMSLMEFEQKWNSLYSVFIAKIESKIIVEIFK